MVAFFPAPNLGHEHDKLLLHFGLPPPPLPPYFRPMEAKPLGCFFWSLHALVCLPYAAREAEATSKAGLWEFAKAGFHSCQQLDYCRNKRGVFGCSSSFICTLDRTCDGKESVAVEPSLLLLSLELVRTLGSCNVFCYYFFQHAGRKKCHSSP